MHFYLLNESRALSSVPVHPLIYAGTGRVGLKSYDDGWRIDPITLSLQEIEQPTKEELNQAGQMEYDWLQRKDTVK